MIWFPQFLVLIKAQDSQIILSAEKLNFISKELCFMYE